MVAAVEADLMEEEDIGRALSRLEAIAMEVEIESTVDLEVAAMRAEEQLHLLLAVGVTQGVEPEDLPREAVHHTIETTYFVDGPTTAFCRKNGHLCSTVLGSLSLFSSVILWY